MAEFQLIWLEGEDLDLVDRIIKSVAGVSSREDAIRWALKQYTPIEKTMVHPIQRDHLKPGLHLDLGYHLELGTHHTCSIPDLAKETDQLEHTVVLAPGTLERLVPDKQRRVKLLGHDIL